MLAKKTKTNKKRRLEALLPRQAAKPRAMKQTNPITKLFKQHCMRKKHILKVWLVLPWNLHQMVIVATSPSQIGIYFSMQRTWAASTRSGYQPKQILLKYTSSYTFPGWKGYVFWLPNKWMKTHSEFYNTDPSRISPLETIPTIALDHCKYAELATCIFLWLL